MLNPVYQHDSLFEMHICAAWFLCHLSGLAFEFLIWALELWSPSLKSDGEADDEDEIGDTTWCFSID